MLKSDEQVYEIKKLSEFNSYHIKGKLINKFDNIVAIGNIRIEICGVPAGIQEGEFVVFNCSRLDVWK